VPGSGTVLIVTSPLVKASVQGAPTVQVPSAEFPLASTISVGTLLPPTVNMPVATALKVIAVPLLVVVLVKEPLLKIPEKFTPPSAVLVNEILPPVTLPPLISRVIDTVPVVGLNVMPPSVEKKCTVVLLSVAVEDVTTMFPPPKVKSMLLANAAVGRASARSANKTTRLIFAPP
jgi:hypothetical protein